MPKDYSLLPYNQVRRTPNEVTDEDWIRTLLRASPVGYLATVFEGQPFINSNTFVYDESAHAIYLHTARVGRTRANIESDDRVCFSVSTIGRFLPAKHALDFSVEYAGVVIFGKGHVVGAKDQARSALQMLLDKYFAHLKPGEDYEPITDQELARTSVYQIQIESWSGKKDEEAPDFPGAFTFGTNKEG